MTKNVNIKEIANGYIVQYSQCPKNYDDVYGAGTTYEEYYALDAAAAAKRVEALLLETKE